MSLSDLTEPDAVHSALDEFDRLGREAFLQKYGYGPAKHWFVRRDDKLYDSKAIAGVAVGYEHPERGPMRNDEFSGGERSVVPRLQELGFEIERREREGASALEEGSAANPRVWLIRAGSEGEAEATALEHDVAVIGWTELGRHGLDESREQLKERIRETYGETRPASLASQAGQIYRFLNDIQDGDLVVLPLKSRPNTVAVGRITGDYDYRPEEPFLSTDATNTRPVTWLDRAIPYERFDPDLREAFGQQGTVSEITKPHAGQRVLAVLEGADASAIHLVLKWSPSIRPDTVDRHREVAETYGVVWWGRQGRPGSTGLADAWIQKLRQQLKQGSDTHVFLHSGAATTWRTRLVAVTREDAEVEAHLIPPYYDDTAAHHTLWVKLTEFEAVEPSEITDNFVLAQSGEPVTIGSLGNQTPLIVRARGTVASRFFILSQGEQSDGRYDDEEGHRYHWTDQAAGAWKALANSAGARFVYYRPGRANDGTSKTYFGAGTVASVTGETRDGAQHFLADLADYEPFDTPVPREQGPARRNVQMSIQEITESEYERLLQQGFAEEPAGEFTPESVRARAEAQGLQLPDALYHHVVAALESGKHVILTGPPGTAKTTLAQVLADTARDAGKSAGYLLTTATADWTTYETIGGLRPTPSNELQFEEGHFLKAIRDKQWLVIDELNRSNFDRAFGQLFTVLSGQAVVLPYVRAGEARPLALVPEGTETPLLDADVLTIPQTWRVIATMNVFDKTLLFEMSFALMRRFAFVEVPAPSAAVFEALIDRAAGGDETAASLTKRLLDLRKLKDLGPAVFMDLAQFVRMRRSLDPSADDRRLLYEGFYSYLLPQFEGISEAGGDELYATIKGMLGAAQREQVRLTLNSVLGLELQAPASSVEEGELVEEELIEADNEELDENE